MEKRLLSLMRRSFLRLSVLAGTLMLFLTVNTVKGQCVPTYTNTGGGWGIGAQSITFGTVSHTFGNLNPTGAADMYVNRFGSYVTTHYPGDVVSLGFVAGNGNSTMANFYVDWNMNNVFDPNTERVHGSPQVNPNINHTATFQIPANTTPGNYRVRMISNFGGMTGWNDPCRSDYAGTCIDFTLQVASFPLTLDIKTLSALPVKLEMGTNNVSVQVQNFTSGQTITSYDIGYRLDNGTATTQSITGRSLGTGAVETMAFTQALNITVPGTYVFKVWARNPNGTGAGVNSNDTVYRTVDVCNRLNGVYTINAAGGATATNFISFTQAVQKLQNCGVSGPVTINVAPGTYTEQISLSFIDGVSATNTITFDGGNSALTTIQFNGNQASPHVIQLANGASYFEFRNLSIFSLNANNGFPVFIRNNVAYCRFAKNHIRTADWNTQNANTNNIPVCISQGLYYYDGFLNVNDVYLDSNRINGGYFGLSYYYGNAGNCFDLKVRNNTIENFYYYGTYFYGFNNIHFNHNKITQRLITGLTGGYAVYYFSSNASGSYQNQFIGNEATRIFQNPYYFSSVGNSGSRGIFANNIGGQGMTNINAWAAYFQSSSNWDVFHNTLEVPNGTTGADAASLYVSSCQNINIQNNILNVSAAGSSALPLRVLSLNGSLGLNFNNYFKAGAASTSAIARIVAADITPANLTTTGGYNANSVSIEPVFVSLTNNLRLSSSAPSPFGATGLGITTDIDGEARCAGFPSMGADESKFASSSVVDFFTDAVIYVNSPTKFYNSAANGEAKSHVWNIDNGAATYITLHITHTFTQTGSYDVELTTTTCDGPVTVVKTIQVVNPTVPPVSAFLSASNRVDQGYPVQFIDQSTGGPSSWLWSTVPANGVQFIGGATAQNPQLVFNVPGTYEICLTASNSAGQGNKACKVAYIQVTEAHNMCVGATGSKSSMGKLFDQGGRFGDYSNNSLCSFLIDPCASSVTLSFEAFNMDLGDVLRVFDGPDATGKPLHTGNGFTGTIVPSDLTAATGKMFVQFQSNAAGVRPGFEATWTSVTKSFAAPIAAFRAPDTLYVGSAFTFISNSTGTDARLRWDFNNDGITDATGEIANYTFNAPGTYLVRLEIEDCGGIDGAAKSIVVLNPTAKPRPDFVSDVRVISPNQTVRFYDRSTQTPTSWQWRITPATHTYMQGTSSTSQNPVVRFNAVGNYNIQLIATNSFGEDSITKTAAIRVVEYCYPGAGLNIDLGITRVTFAGIDNPSQVGPVTYSDFSVSVKSAAVQKGTKYPITVQRTTANEDMSRRVWIDYNGDGIFGATELVASHNADRSLSWTDTITIPTNVTEGSTRMRIGTSYGITNNSACGVNPYGEFEDYTVTIYDNLTRPVITLLGSPVESIEVGTSYTDAGATAMDDVDGNLTASMIASTNLNTMVVGTYFYRYNVSDLNGNSAEATRIIHVTPDVTAPQITLNGANPFNVVLGTQFIDPGASAIDSYDGVLPSSSIQVVGNVNSLQVGQYIITYTAFDAAGNSAFVQRTVNVGDTTSPVILLRGADEVTIALNDVFVDPGAIVIDDNSMNLPYFVDYTVIDNEVVGDYVLVYTAADPSGNQALPVTRTVKVRDLTAPTLILIGDTVTVEVNTSFSDPGFLVSDNYDATVPVNVSGSVNINKTGIYLLFYTATDAGGNSSPTLLRLVRVVDTKAPVITLNGDKFLTICRWSDYTDPGYVATDNYDANVEVEVFSNLDSEWEGLYSIRYVARDNAGNRAVTAERVIRVVACATGTEELNAAVVKVYPNPSRGVFTLSSSAPLDAISEIRVMDALGKQISFQSSTQHDEVQMDLSGQPAGVYFIHISINGNWTAHKVQIVK